MIEKEKQEYDICSADDKTKIVAKFYNLELAKDFMEYQATIGMKFLIQDKNN